MAVSNRIAQDIIEFLQLHHANVGGVFHEKLFHVQIMAHYPPVEFDNYADTLNELIYRGLIERSYGAYVLTQDGFDFLNGIEQLARVV